MVWKILCELLIDIVFVFCYVCFDQFFEFEDFFCGINVVNIEEFGDKVYEEGLYEVFKIFYSSIFNWVKFVIIFVYLGDYQVVVDCVCKVNNIKVWKQVYEVCVEKKEFCFVQICGFNLIVDVE